MGQKRAACWVALSWVLASGSIAACSSAPAAPDVGSIDAGSDASARDAGRDGGADAGMPDVGVDAASDPDTGVDAFVAPDAGVDAFVDLDVGVDAFVAMDAGVDAFVPVDVGVDVGVDAFVPVDVGVDVGVDAFVPVDVGTDSGTPCPPRLDPTDDPGATPSSLVMSELAPGMFIELYNDTASPLVLGSAPHWFCSPFTYVSLASLGAGITIPAHSYATIPWPASFSDTSAGGEIQLFASASFGDSSQIVDFVCWGTNPHGSRIAQGFAAGKWSSSSASSCAPALTGGSIHRRVMTDGIDAADYDTSSPPSPATCTPP